MGRGCRHNTCGMRERSSARLSPRVSTEAGMLVEVGVGVGVGAGGQWRVRCRAGVGGVGRGRRRRCSGGSGSHHPPTEEEQRPVEKKARKCSWLKCAATWSSRWRPVGLLPHARAASRRRLSDSAATMGAVQRKHSIERAAAGATRCAIRAPVGGQREDGEGSPKKGRTPKHGGSMACS